MVLFRNKRIIFCHSKSGLVEAALSLLVLLGCNGSHLLRLLPYCDCLATILKFMKLFLLSTSLVALVANGVSCQSVSQLHRPMQLAVRASTKAKNRPSLCGDLLQQYASKPAGLMLTSCEDGRPGSQMVAVATYQVSGANAAQVETFFRARYGMGKLTFVCCGWEPANGKHGQVDNAALRRLNPAYSLLITMHSDANIMEQALAQGDASAWKDKRKVKRFLVEVSLVEV